MTQLPDSNIPQPPQAAPTSAAAAPAEPAAKAMVTYDDFVKLDLRVGKVIEAREHPNADKLLVVTVDMGTEKRQVIAGIRANYTPESLVGMEVIVVANLQPRKMRGLESAGMILATSYSEGDARNVVVLSPQREVPPGSPVS